MPSEPVQFELLIVLVLDGELKGMRIGVRVFIRKAKREKDGEGCIH